jgi:hypothetical protein
MLMMSRHVRFRGLCGVALALLVTACVGFGTTSFEQRFGKAVPAERVVDRLPADRIDYWSEVKPVIDKRCVVCHGCYDAPCQLKMSAIEGIVRGASTEKVYQSNRLHAAPPTRLFEDAQSVSAWRDKGFHPVLNEHADTPEANREASVMYRMLALKQQHPLPDVKQLPDSFELGLNRKQVCTQAETFDQFAEKHPLWGMPYALPGLAPEEQEVLTGWVEQGAVYTPRSPLPSTYAAKIEHWERFLNGRSLKQQLASRYIYEHLSFAHLYFPEVEELRFFTLVRSSTPPGQPIEIIATRRPYDPPGVERVYYRIQELVTTIVDKTHMPYALDGKRMQRWQSLFIDADYTVSALPSYDAEEASNPFQSFAELPINARHRFLLDEAQFTIMSFIKGPVCRGEVAVDVIDDNFWVFFTDPGRSKELRLEEFLAGHAQSLTLPASTENIYRPVHNWHQYARQQSDFLAQKDQFLADNYGGAEAVTIDGIWDGDGVNQNAALTVYRHFDNATVLKGLQGQPPKTAWLVDYTLLERIHYLLVAGYDVYGNLGHQLDTRLYMDFLRMEGEANFLLMLPEAARVAERDYWYRDADQKLKQYISSPVFENQSVPNIDYRTEHPKLELFEMLRQRLAAVLPVEHDMATVPDAAIREPLLRINQLLGTPATHLPENALLRVTTSAGSEYFSLLRNTAYASMSSLFGEDKNRLPNEDSATILRGFIGAYPKAFFVVNDQRVSDFVDLLSGIETEADYALLLDRYGIRRTHRDFWRQSDAFHEGYKQSSPLAYGVLDYNRLENR